MDENKTVTQMTDEELDERITALDALRKTKLVADLWAGTAAADLSDSIAALPADLGEMVAVLCAQAYDATDDRVTMTLWQWGAIRLCERLQELGDLAD